MVITRLAEEIRQQVAAYAQLTDSASRVSDITSTADDLINLRREVAAWASTYAAVEPCLPLDQRAALRGQARVVWTKVNDSRTKFGYNNYAQHDALAQVQQRVKRLSEQTQQCWYVYAQERIRPLRVQVDLAKQLPKMRDTFAEIEAAAAEIEKLAQQSPRRSTEVDAFHRKVDVLDHALQSIKGLTAEQKVFLDKARHGTATLNDVTESLLAWCKQENLAVQLKIRL